MSEIEENSKAAASPLAGIPPELVNAFFTGDQNAIARFLTTNPAMVRGILQGLPPGVRRVLAETDDVIDAEPEPDGEDEVDEDEDEEIEPAPVVGRRRAGSPKVAQAPARRRVVEPEPEPEEEDEPEYEDEEYSDDVRAALQANPVAAMNDLGLGIAGMLAELPGVQLGITFLPGGRKVTLAFYYPGAEGDPEEILAQHTAHVSRFGDLIDTAYATAEHAVGLERADDALDGYDEDDEDDEDEEVEEEPRPVRRRRR